MATTAAGAGRRPRGALLAAAGVDHPWRVVVAALVLLVVGGVAGIPVAGALASGGFEDPNSQASQADARVLQATGLPVDSSMILLVRSGGDVRSGPGRELVARVAADLRASAGVARVVDPVSTPLPQLISTDGRSAYMVGYVTGARPADEEAAAAIAARLQARYPQVTAGGYLVAFRQVSDQVGRDLARAETLAGPILFLVLAVILRGAVSALLPLAVGLLSILTAFAGLRAVNAELSLSIFALNLVTGLGLGLAIDYGLLLIFRYREEARGLGYTPAALRRTLATAGRTVLFSSLTVAASAAALTVFPQRFLYSMGIGGVIVTMVSAVVALTLMPALLVLLGDRVERLGWFRLERSTPAAERRGGWYRLSRAVMRRPVTVAAVTGALMLVLGAPFLRITFTSVDASVLPQSASARQVNDALRSDFGGDTSQPVHAVVEASTTDPATSAGVGAFARGLASLAGVREVQPPQRLDGDTWMVDVVPSQPTLSDRTQQLVREVRAAASAQPFAVRVGGNTAQFVDLQSSLRDHLPAAVAILVASTLVLLWVMTGSVVLPVKAVVMNALTISAAFGLLVLVFQDGRLTRLLDYQSQGALESTQPILLFAIAFGLSTDYGVMLLTRIREAYDAGLPTTEAVALGLERTGRIVTAAAVLMAIALTAFATSSIVFIKELGLGAAAAVLIDASVVRAFLVPALMKLLGEWNWWSPRPLRALHRRLGLEDLEGPVPRAA